MGAFLALKTKGHIAVETLLHSLFKPEARKYVTAIADFLILYFCIYLAYMGVMMMQKTANDLTPVMLIPFSYLYAAIALSGILMTVYLLIRAFALERKTLIVSFLASLVLCGAALLRLRQRWIFKRESRCRDARLLFSFLSLPACPSLLRLASAACNSCSCKGKIPLVVTHTRMFGGGRFLSASGRALLHPGRRADEYRRRDRAAGGPGQGSGRAYPRRSGNGRGGRRILLFRNLRLDGGRRLGDRFTAHSGDEKKQGYSSETCVSIVSAATAMGILVPPCILMVVLGGNDRHLGGRPVHGRLSPGHRHLALHHGADLLSGRQDESAGGRKGHVQGSRHGNGRGPSFR